MMHRLRNYFLSGLVVFLPLALTIYIFILTINFAEDIFGKYLAPYFYDKVGFYFKGISVLVGLLVILAIGFFVTNFLGRKIYEFFENILIKLPFFRQVYPALKEMAIFLFSRDKMRSFKQVVLVPYPRKGIYSMGFLTNQTGQAIAAKTREELCNVFISSSPSPLTGFTVIVPKKEIIFLDISVEDAFKFIVSGGVVNPLQ